MNFKLWTIVSVLALLTFANGNPSNKRAPDGKSTAKKPYLGNCETDEDCPGAAVCLPPGFGKASPNAQKKCYAALCSCPTGWIRYNDMCYLFEQEFSGNIDAAKDFCEDRDAILAEPRTRDVNEFITAQLNSLKYATYWFGLTNFDGNGYVWCSDGTAPTYTEWIVSWGNECASYEPAYYYYWAKDGCHYSQLPICQKSIPCNLI